jgi:hypothetical protein
LLKINAVDSEDVFILLLSLDVEEKAKEEAKKDKLEGLKENRKE